MHSISGLGLTKRSLAVGSDDVVQLSGLHDLPINSMWLILLGLRKGGEYTTLGRGPQPSRSSAAGWRWPDLLVTVCHSVPDRFQECIAAQAHQQEVVLLNTTNCHNLLCNCLLIIFILFKIVNKLTIPHYFWNTLYNPLFTCEDG